MQEPLFFMHVPKVAGVSLHDVLKSSFAEHEVCPQPADGVWRASQAGGFRLYSGHFGMDFIEELGGGGSKLIMLRHPVDRVVSMYDYWRSYRWKYLRAIAVAEDDCRFIAKVSNFSAFLGSPVVETALYNETARFLLGKDSELLVRDEAQATEEALRRLEQFAWIGITDLFDVSVASLREALALPARKIVHANLTYQRCKEERDTFEAVRRTHPSAAQRRRILEGNRVDMALYVHGRALLLQRAARVGKAPLHERLRARLSGFRKTQRIA